MTVLLFYETMNPHFDYSSINPKKKKRYRPIDFANLQKYVQQTSDSNIPQATRRLFFTFTEATIEERGFYRADMLGGMGSGILLFYKEKYFLLTANHVVIDTVKSQQNESPFFVLARNSSPGQFDLKYLLLPRWHWDIRTLMPDSGGDVAWKDVALIEMFDPMCEIPTDEVVDLERIQILERREFFEGQCLIGSGFPEVANRFQFGEADQFGEGLAQATNHQRHHCTGLLVKGDGPNDFFFQPTDPKVDHAALNGMSGGSLVNLYPQAKKTRWAGMLKAVDGRNFAQFIPAYALLPILRRYAESPRSNLDPNAGKPCSDLSPKVRSEVQQFMRQLVSGR